MEELQEEGLIPLVQTVSKQTAQKKKEATTQPTAYAVRTELKLNPNPHQDIDMNHCCSISTRAVGQRAAFLPESSQQLSEHSLNP